MLVLVGVDVAALLLFCLLCWLCLVVCFWHGCVYYDVLFVCVAVVLFLL